MALLAHKLLAVAGLGRPNIAYVGGAFGTHTGVNIPIAIDDLSGGIGAAAAVGDLVIGAVAIASGSNLFLTTAQWDAKQADLYPANLGAMSKLLMVPTTSLLVSYSGGIGVEPSAWAVQVWRRIDQSTPIDTATTTASGTGSGAVNPPAITTVTPGAFAIVVGGTAASGVSDLTIPDDMGFFVHSRNGNAQVAMAAANVTAPTAFDPPLFGGGVSGGSPGWAAASIAIRPE